MAAVYPKYVKAVAILDKSAAGPLEQNKLPLDKFKLSDPLTKDWFDLLPSIKCLMMIVRSSSQEGIPDEEFIKMQSLIPNYIALWL